MLDGAVTPELIPDLIAYRLYLAMVSKPANASDDEMKHQAAQIGKIGLSDADRQALSPILASFNSRYQNLIADYNRQATAAWANNTPSDTGALVLQLDQLVQATHDTLKSVLSGDGWLLLDAHVQDEKKKMKIGVQEVQQ